MQAGGFQASFVSGSKISPILNAREICTNPEADNLIASARWYENRFTQVITNYNPTVVIAKIHYDVKNQAGLLNHGFPLGILAQCCNSNALDLKLVTLQKLKGPKNFDMPKGTSTYEWVDSLKDTKPYWKDAGRVSCLAAIMFLS
ncbi:MAG: hypothetical protein ACSHXY_13110 [Alphaproteobacteria bacterium]